MEDSSLRLFVGGTSWELLLMLEEDKLKDLNEREHESMIEFDESWWGE